MKINFVKVEYTDYRIQLLKKPCLEVLKKTKTLRLVSVPYTSTTLDTSLIWDNASMGINHCVEGFKTLHIGDFNYAHRVQHDFYYFKKTKKQGLEEYKKYVETILQTLFADLGIDELMVEYTNLEELFK